MGRPSTLTDNRQWELESIGFAWDAHKASWDDRVQGLLDFRSKYGTVNVPSYFTDQALATWVKAQRRSMRLRKKGMKNTLTDERVAQLDSLGFDWNPRNL